MRLFLEYGVWKPRTRPGGFEGVGAVVAMVAKGEKRNRNDDCCGSCKLGPCQVGLRSRC